MADNVGITPGSGNTIAADEVIDGTLGTVKVQYVKLMDGTIDGTSKALIDASGLQVNTELPVAAVLADNDPNPTTPTIGADLMVFDGTTWDRVRSSLGDGTPATGLLQCVPMLFNGASFDRIRGSVSGGLVVSQRSADLIISITGAAAAAVTATLPAVASQFHYISTIEITKYFTAANAASATPLVVTTTNLPGSLAFSFGQPLGTIGTSETRIFPLTNGIKSSVVNTNTTIVCPATAGIIWRINVLYFAAV